MDVGSGTNSYIRDVRIYEAIPSEVIIDTDAGAPGYTETGSWVNASTNGYNGGGYRWANAGQNHTATWNLNVPAAGTWRVDVIYRAGSNRTSSTRFTTATASGNQTVFINQKVNNLTWVTLGTWDFNAGSGAVTLEASGSSGGAVVIADAVRITRIP
jgi:hypothetical protein